MRHNILIIAASSEVQQSIYNKVGSYYYLYKCKDLAGALATLRRHPIHLVICAAGSKAPLGCQLCRELKSDDLTAHIPVILITTQENLHLRIKCLEAGADVHIGGPVFREHLDVQIRSLIANRAKVREYFSKDAPVNDDPKAKPDHHLIANKLNSCLVDFGAQKDLSVDQLAKRMHMSRPTLYRKIKSITPLTPNELINEARLRKAAELLTTGEYRVCDVARLVGYGSSSSFGKSFLKQFKVTPAAYQRMKKVINAA